MTSPAGARCAPFATYLAFIALEQALKGPLNVSPSSLLYLYPVKAVVVSLVLVILFRQYDELRFSDWKNLTSTAVSIVVGLVVFVLWINMAWTTQDVVLVIHDSAKKLGLGLVWTPKNPSALAGYDPFQLQNAATRNFLVISRIIGAAVIVPVMEELFWRSFLLRYLVANDFTKVAVGTFTWGSFAAVALLFGLEHDYLIAGVMAGVAYNLLAVYTRSIAQCVLSHGVTNLVLGIYVLTTGKWQFW
jgi:CAAX prenyl protease-like protein